MTALALPTLTWARALTWRLHRHGLDERRADLDLTQTSERPCGVHAQVLPCAELSPAVRVAGATPHGVRTALRQRRSLAKTWAVRGTLHLLPSRSLQRYAATLRTDPTCWTAEGDHPSEQDLALVADLLGTSPDLVFESG